MKMGNKRFARIKIFDRWRRTSAFLLSLCILFGLSGCAPFSSGPSTGENSPRLEDLTVYGECRGGEDDQYIVAELHFDREIRLNEGLPGQVRAVIGGKRISEDEMTAEQSSGEAVMMTFHVDRVVDGELELTKAPGTESITAVTDAEGRNCLADLQYRKIVPSGVTIHREEENIYVVDSVPTHRSIVWIRVLADGEILSPGGAANTDVRDNAAAVHEHDFLWATEASVAEDIADVINEYYASEGITAAAEGDRILLKRSVPGTGELTLMIYEGES